jgi:proteasome maturation protein
MRIAPPASHPKSKTSSLGAPSAPGVHDTLRAGVGPTVQLASASTAAVQIDSNHPLESRLAQWTATQDALKMEGLRRTFGMAEPIRRGMELKIAREGEWRPVMLGGGRPGVHEDILSGRDTSIGWEDVFTGTEMRGLTGIHEEMETKVRMA